MCYQELSLCIYLRVVSNEEKCLPCIYIVPVVICKCYRNVIELMNKMSQQDLLAMLPFDILKVNSYNY